EPCAARPEGSTWAARGEGKAIGSSERMVEALLLEYNVAFAEARYRDAVSLAEHAVQLDPGNGAAEAALKMATTQRALRMGPLVPEEPPTFFAAAVRRQVADLTARSHNDFQRGRYEEARAAALRVLAVSPGDPVALTIVQQSVEAMNRLQGPEPA